MALSVFTLIVIGVVVYFHYLQGFFSSMLSAIFAVLSAMLALGWAEYFVSLFPDPKFADLAYGILLCATFALSYSAMRLVFDKVVPGNVAFPLWVDRFGAGVAGLIAGIFAGGILLIAAQSLPFTPSILGYQRFAVSEEKNVLIQQGNRQADAKVVEVDEEAFLSNDASGLLIPVDSWTISLVRLQSDRGALSRGVPFEKRYPDLLRTFYGQRVGRETGARRVGYLDSVKVQAVWQQSFTTSQQVDYEKNGVRSDRNVKDRGMKRVEPFRDEGKLTVAVRLQPDVKLTDEDKLFRFSPANVRLVIDGVDHYPLGFIADGILHRTRIDDWLFVQDGKAFDLVFAIDKTAGLARTAGPAAKARLASPAFIEVKRMARVELNGRELSQPKALDAATQGIMRRGSVAPERPQEQESPPQSGESASPADLPVDASMISAGRFRELPVAIAAGTSEPDGLASPTWGSVVLRDGKFFQLNAKATDAAELGRGENPIKALWVPERLRLAEVRANLKRDAGSWNNQEIRRFTLLDRSGTSFEPVGAILEVIQGDLPSGSRSKIVAIAYAAETDAGPLALEVPTGTRGAGTITFLYLVPQGAVLDRLEYNRSAIKQFENATIR